jgi:beta-glucosidase-like glycosyl hydrolase/CubicO group peptidase (beta-lactamase class C family)
MKPRLILIFLISFLALSSFYPVDAAFESPTEPKKIPYLKGSHVWADSVLAQMTIDEKIGQLFNIPAYSNEKINKEEVERLIKEYHIGGVTFFQGDISKQAELTNHYQSISKLPLMVAMDAEWGMAMRIDSVVKYPWQMTLGAIQDDHLIYQMGRDIAKQMRRIGVNVSFSPVVDVNNNPNNPIINARSFGEDKDNVARKGIAYMQGLQDGKVLASAKHFPGHGDTDMDSHKTLPLIDKTATQLDSIELYPFKQLIKKGVGSIMIAHLNIPAYTKESAMPSSLTPSVVTDLLRDDLKYKGITFTDGLNMSGVAARMTSEQVDVAAIKAGNDILLLSRDVPKGVAAIKKAIVDSVLSVSAIDEKVLKILRAKHWMKLHDYKEQPIDGLYSDLNLYTYQSLNKKLTAASLTVLRNKNNTLPLSVGVEKIAVLSVGEGDITPFQKRIGSYANADFFNIADDLPVADQKSMMDQLNDYETVIVGIHRSDKNPWVKYDLSDDLKGFINVLRLKKKVILVVFANAYALRNFLATEYVDGLIVSYQNSVAAQEMSAELIFGGRSASGKLPVSVSRTYPVGSGLTTNTTGVLYRAMPEDLGYTTDAFAQVDIIAQDGINKGAYPGCQILIAKEGKIIYDKQFGHPTYEENRAVQPDDLYDIASVTKITATLLAVMDLVSQEKLSLDDNLGKHLGKLVKNTDYADLSLREILAHQAGLAAWIPFYVKTLENGVPSKKYYRKVASEEFSIRVADSLYISEAYEDTIFFRIIHRAKVNPKKEYRYSDVGYYFLKEIVEKVTEQPIEDYLQTNFYQPMGMAHTTFNPRERFPLSQLIPTEDDRSFRNQLIWGDVHDPGAAMLGGVGGHAGLFSTANDLAKLMQLYLNGGTYGGKQYLNKSVIDEFVKCQFCKKETPMSAKENRRAAGFDKPAFHGNPGPTCDCVSYASFGHSGFTGTYAWADPEEQIVYIFLSNRVYPDANNKKLLQLNIRTDIQERIYQAIQSNREHSIN